MVAFNGVLSLNAAPVGNTFLVTSGQWNDPANWSDGVVPKRDQTVIIPDGTFVTVKEGQEIEFETLYVGDDSESFKGSYLIMMGEVAHGTNLYITSQSYFLYRNNASTDVPLYLYGDFFLDGGTFNGSSSVRSEVQLMIEAENITVEDGSLLAVWQSGHRGFTPTRGAGPGGGLNSSGPGNPSQGGNHDYCDVFETPYISTFGSSSGGEYDGLVLTERGEGGGNLVIKARNKFVLNGRITVDGGEGGAGGAITMMGDQIIGGANGVLSAHGGFGDSSYDTGRGGCVKVIYQTSSSFSYSRISVLGGRYGASGRSTSGSRVIGQGIMPDLGIEPKGTVAPGTGELDTSLACDSLTGDSRSILSDSLNEGSLNFNDVGVDPAHRGCLYRSDVPLPDRRYFGGWVWNTNLGWVSLGAFDESGTVRNRGIDFGSQEYRSYIDLSYDATGEVIGGEMYGYFWGDATGWIRLNCDHSGYSFDGDAGFGDNYCATSDHAVVIDAVNASGYASLTGYAWSDNLGWIDMRDVNVPLNNLFSGYEAVVETIGVQYLSDEERAKRGGGVTRDVLTDTNPKANGLGMYQLNVNILNTNLDPADQDITHDLFDDPNIDFSFVFNDSRTHLLDEVPEARPDEHGDKYGYMRFDIDKSSFEKDLATGGIRLNSSLYYPKTYVPAEGNQLAITSVNLEVNSGTTTYTVPLPVETFLEFDPPYDLELFQNRSGDAVNLASCEKVASRNEGLELEIGVNDQIALCGELFIGGLTIGGTVAAEPIKKEFTSVFNYDITRVIEDTSFLVAFIDAADPTTLYVDNFTDTFLKGFDNILLSLIVQLGDIGESLNIDDVISGVNISTNISYTTPLIDPIRGGLLVVTKPGPLIENTNLSVAAANVSGNVQSGAFEQIKSDVSARGSGRGGSSRLVQREAILKSVNEFTRNKRPDTTCLLNGTKSTELYIDAIRFDRCRVSDEEEIYVIEFDGDHVGKLLRISDVPELAAAPNRTLVVSGANVVIDQDIYFNDSSGDLDPSQAFGLVVLKSGNNGGNVYITTEVNDLRGHIYADGSAFVVQDEAHAAVAVNGVPERLYTNANEMYSQLTIAGSIVSENTVGGALERPPKLGDNSIAESVDEAKKFDINFWRKSPLRHEIKSVSYDHDGDSETPEVELSYVRMCGPSAERDFIRTSPLTDSDYPSGISSAGISSVGWYPADKFFDEDDRVFRNSAAKAAEYCWQDEIGGIDVETSKYMIDVRNQEEELPSQWKVVNIIFESVPSVLPLFTD
jgi:hypothetical protein